MRKNSLLLMGLILLLAACTPSGAASPIETSTATSIPPTPTLAVSATPAPFFSVYSNEPIVSKGEAGTWDDRYTDPGAVLY